MFALLLPLFFEENAFPKRQVWSILPYEFSDTNFGFLLITAAFLIGLLIKIVYLMDNPFSEEKMVIVRPQIPNFSDEEFGKLMMKYKNSVEHNRNFIFVQIAFTILGLFLSLARAISDFSVLSNRTFYTILFLFGVIFIVIHSKDKKNLTPILKSGGIVFGKNGKMIANK